MQAFACPHCGQLVYFENDECLRCHAGLGFDPSHRTIIRVGPRPGPEGPADAGADGGFPGSRRCANRELAGCNWLLGEGEPPGLCLSCRLTRTRPDDETLHDDPGVAEQFVRAQAAKRRLVFQLLELDLPPVSNHRNAPVPLAFDFLVKQDKPITIGHADGVITIDLAESDDAYRERMRIQLGEPYRTMLGHLRHEVGHYHCQVLVEPKPAVRDQFRQLFGDERADYQAALERHYDEGPPADFEEEYVSAYAAAHPWEDWAETWAHYLHIRDTLQTAASFGVIVLGPRLAGGLVDRRLDASLMAAPGADAGDDFDEILAEWLPLTYALNAINRSMGKGDLYPFVLRRKVIEKLRFVHDQVVGPGS